MAENVSKNVVSVKAQPSVTVTPQQVQQFEAIQKEKEAKEQALRDQFTQLIFELLTKSNELAFELATVDCENAKNCEVCSKAKELIKVVKKIVALQKQASQM